MQAVLLIGGAAHIPGIGPALESRFVWPGLFICSRLDQFFCRLQAIATPVVSGMEKVQVIPPPKDVNPQILVWKGGAVLGKMESVSELWVTAADWVGPQLSSVESADCSDQRKSWACVVSKKDVSFCRCS